MLDNGQVIKAEPGQHPCRNLCGLDLREWTLPDKGPWPHIKPLQSQAEPKPGPSIRPATYWLSPLGESLLSLRVPSHPHPRPGAYTTDCWRQHWSWQMAHVWLRRVPSSVHSSPRIPLMFSRGAVKFSDNSQNKSNFNTLSFKNNKC